MLNVCMHVCMLLDTCKNAIKDYENMGIIY